MTCIGCVDAAAFGKARSFNGDLSSWDVSSVTTLYGSKLPLDWSFVVRGRASVAGRGPTTCPLDDGCGVCVTCIGCVDAPAFRGASSFNGDLSSWDVSSVTTLESSKQPLDWSFVVRGRESVWSGSYYVCFGMMVARCVCDMYRMR